jgi:glutamate formiminotransferase
MTVIEAVPNISEGRRGDVLTALADAVNQVPDVFLLNTSADPSHNRCVLSIVGPPAPLLDALLDIYEVALQSIDLRTHQGVHPRIGAIDVVPFIPIHGASMADCVALTGQLGRAIADRFSVPVFLYGETATRPKHRALEAIRRGQFEGLAEKMTTDGWQPNFGPMAPHPSAGASAIGARGPLIAFNVNLDTDDITAARAVAETIRESSGGLSSVKAIGVRLEHRGIVQVSVNLTDYTKTPLHRVFAAIKYEATLRGIKIIDSEVVGLMPMAAMVTTAAELRLEPFDQNQLLEARLRALGFSLPSPLIEIQ